MMKIKTRKYLFLATALFNFWNIELRAQETKDLTELPKQILEAKKIGNIRFADSLVNIYINQYLFKLRGQDLFTKDNLTFLSDHLSGTESSVFKIFLKNPRKVNSILGKDKAEYLVRFAISEEYFKGLEPSKKPNVNWTSLKKIIESKFGEMGLEALYSKQMVYYLHAKDWSNFGNYYVLYFKRALKRPEYNVNDITWDLFENVNDLKILSFACDAVMKYAIEEWYQNDPISWDTYANLLYKTGKINQAIDWEEKVVKVKAGQPDEKLYTDALEKMKKGLPTWIEPASN